jgi:hypothetical protein
LLDLRTQEPVSVQDDWRVQLIAATHSAN